MLNFKIFVITFIKLLEKLYIDNIQEKSTQKKTMGSFLNILSLLSMFSEAF